MIAGLIDWTNPVESRASLRRMMAAAATYPHGDSWECHHAPYRACAASATPQPANEVSIPVADDPRTGSWIVADATIYNRAELIESLGLENAKRSLGSDAALLLAAYQRWGPELLRRVVGDFAFAIWDGREECLFAAVDAFGLRPFYFSSSHDCLGFASRTNMLEALAWVGDAVNERQAVCFLLDQYDDAEATFSKRVRQLPIGHSLHWKRGSPVTVRRYWDPARWPRNECRTPQEVLERFEELVRLAVRQRLDPKTPTGILMSGGYDSTSVAGMVSDIQRRESSVVPPITVLSWVFDDLPCDESKYIRAALSDFRLPGCQVRELDGGNSVELMRAEIGRHDIPILNPQGRLFASFTDQARTLGLGVLMTGLGGDELATDMGYHADLLRAGSVIRFLRQAFHARERHGKGMIPFLRRALRTACPQTAKHPYRAFRRWLGMTRSADAPGWLSPQASALAREIAPVFVAGFRSFRSCTAELLWQGITAPYLNWANRWWSTEFSAFGMRLSAPLLDRRLFEFVLQVPPRLRLWEDGHRFSKLLLTKGLPGCLPEEIRQRGKTVIFDDYCNLMFDNGLVELSHCLFDDASWQADALVPRDQAQALFTEYRQWNRESSQDLGEKSDRVTTLWRIAGLELWLRARQERVYPFTADQEVDHGPPLRQARACAV
jgi:asparagine synthase (glutamine-hydrolysing)